jgi:hypothetical protein
MVTKVVCDQLVVKEQDSKSKLSNLDIYSSKDSCRRMVKNVEKGNYNTLEGASVWMAMQVSEKTLIFLYPTSICFNIVISNIKCMKTELASMDNNLYIKDIKVA